MKVLLVFLLIIGSTPAFAALPIPEIDLPDIPFMPSLEPTPTPVPDPPKEKVVEEVKPDPIAEQNAREEAKKLQAEIVIARDNLLDAENNVRLKEAEILSRESIMNVAEKDYKDAKVLYDKNPDESKRVTVETNLAKMNSAITNFNSSIIELRAVKDQVLTLKNNLISLEAQIVEVKEDKSAFKKISLSDAPKTIGVILSNSCLTMLKAGIYTVCPSYEALMSLGLDTSLPVSGEFYYDKFEVYKRGDSLIRNDHLMYNLQEYNIIIDPSTVMKEKIALITITPNLGTYLLAADMEKIGNKRVYHTDRYISDCKDGTITASTWTETLDDTIFFMRNGCQGFLGGTVIEIEDPVTVTNIVESGKWKFDTWLAQVKEDYKVNRIGLDVNENPAVYEDED